MDARAGATRACARAINYRQLPLFFVALICHLSWRTICSSAQHFKSVQAIRLYSAQEPVTGLPPTSFGLRTLWFDHCHLFFSYGKCLKQLLEDFS